MVDYLPRSEWGARAARPGPGPLLASRVEGVADHYPGMAKPINAIGEAGKARIASALRGWQAYHMDGRGWSDIAYLIAVDQAGRAWTLRGLNMQSGANGNQDANQRFGAVLLILAPGEEPSAAMKKTVREVHTDFRRRFAKSRVRPYGHQEVRQHTSSGEITTECPGKTVMADIRAGELDAIVAAPPVKPGGTPTPVPPATNQPVVDLSALQYHAKMGTGKYSPLSSGPMCEGVKKRLVTLGCGTAGSSFRTCYAAWQRKLGYTGTDADGIPGMSSLQKLATKSNWRVVA